MQKCEKCDSGFDSRRGLSVHHYRQHDESIAQRTEVSCDHCNKSFEKKDAVIKITAHDFCSESCRDEWQSEEYRGKSNPMYGVERPEHSDRMSGSNNPAWKGGKSSRIARKRRRKNTKNGGSASSKETLTLVKSVGLKKTFKRTM